ncbi:hypothetical protein BDY21DRAFT_393120 [Lineolata rhizophorae]|uniref:Uncharacterized protein n=1 Tax=Lineolata rhizophorae TaxID=578093 RepID=A0A6A6NZ53_9PEZI|nr:hypothetical protein BDY21DRAFT_393120 [Lineolata rhizophorae]
MPPKSVLIVGGGPSGLVAAKTLLRIQPEGAFNVKLLEADDRLGGLWAVRRGEVRRGKLPADMPTNLSRFTVSFSDLDWNEVDGVGTQIAQPGDSPAGPSCSLDGKGGAQGARPFVPLFPEAWKVCKYIEAYAKKFIPDGVVHLRSRVTKAQRIIQDDGREKWRETFDHLVFACGFFSTPRPLSAALEGSKDPSADLPINVVHSSEFRAIEDLVPSDAPGGGNIVVIGGGISGGEAAATIAFQISTSLHSAPPSRRFEDVRVQHITARPFYSLNRHMPSKSRTESGSFNHATPFLPFDLHMYDLSRRPAPIKASSGPMPPDRAPKQHAFIRDMVGGDQSELGSPALVYGEEETKFPAYVALTDTYANFVRSGAIITTRGRATAVEKDPPGKAVVKAESPSGAPITISNVVGVVYATGYTPAPALRWLPEDVLSDLGFDPCCFRLPTLLHDAQTRNPRVPSLGFVGFYEGPYWGVMEMQARLLARCWSQPSVDGGATASTTTDLPDSASEPAFIRSLRHLLRAKDPSLPAFWMGDIIGLMESLSRAVGSAPPRPLLPPPLTPTAGPAVPARYTAAAAADDAAAASRARSELADTLAAARGAWVLRRRLVSSLSGFPSGAFEGSAVFHARRPSADGFAGEYLYVERGTLRTDKGWELRASRRYVYRYCAETDVLSTWFVKADGVSVDYLFNELVFEGLGEDRQGEGGEGEDQETGERGWVARGDHLCEEDQYDSTWEFRFRGSAIERWGVRYGVKGPKKDYVSDTWYEREKRA